ncbi:MAG: helix-turn-helix domain-containing protein [Treponema sp.]|nr:helix-turn-helix domain-containing protein [Treponema sp.]
MATLGERLKQLRIENNLRQKDLSNEFNVTERMIQYYEANKSEPSLKVIKFACERFNVSADYFLGLSDERTIIKQLDKRLYK